MQSALVVVNSPYTLPEEVGTLLPFLADVLAEDHSGTQRAVWLTPPT